MESEVGIIYKSKLMTPFRRYFCNLKHDHVNLIILMFRAHCTLNRTKRFAVLQSTHSFINKR